MSFQNSTQGKDARPQSRKLASQIFFAGFRCPFSPARYSVLKNHSDPEGMSKSTALQRYNDFWLGEGWLAHCRMSAQFGISIRNYLRAERAFGFIKSLAEFRMASIEEIISTSKKRTFEDLGISKKCTKFCRGCHFTSVIPLTVSIMPTSLQFDTPTKVHTPSLSRRMRINDQNAQPLKRRTNAQDRLESDVCTQVLEVDCFTLSEKECSSRDLFSRQLGRKK